jgi:hypothetical protein
MHVRLGKAKDDRCSSGGGARTPGSTTVSRSASTRAGCILENSAERFVFRVRGVEMTPDRRGDVAIRERIGFLLERADPHFDRRCSTPTALASMKVWQASFCGRGHAFAEIRGPALPFLLDEFALGCRFDLVNESAAQGCSG